MSRQQNVSHEDASHSHGLHTRSRMSTSSPDIKRRLALIESVSEPIVELEMEEATTDDADDVSCGYSIRLIVQRILIRVA